MAEKPQFYQDTKRVDRVVLIEAQMADILNRVKIIKADAELLKVEIDADPGSPSDMTTLGNQINNFVNNVIYTDFISYVTNALA